MSKTIQIGSFNQSKEVEQSKSKTKVHITKVKAITPGNRQGRQRSKNPVIKSKNKTAWIRKQAETLDLSENGWQGLNRKEDIENNASVFAALVTTFLHHWRPQKMFGGDFLPHLFSTVIVYTKTEFWTSLTAPFPSPQRYAVFQSTTL